jgi:hypothetical protein
MIVFVPVRKLSLILPILVHDPYVADAIVFAHKYDLFTIEGKRSVAFVILAIREAHGGAVVKPRLVDVSPARPRRRIHYDRAIRR